MHHRPLTRSLTKTDKAKSVEIPGSSAPSKRLQIPKQGRIDQPPSFTPIKIEEPKESSSSSSSSASSTVSLSPPPSPRMDDQLPPPPAAPKSLADYNKPSATSVRSSIAVPRIDGNPDYDINIPFLTMVSRDLQFQGRPLDSPCTHLADFIDLYGTFKNGNLDKNTLSSFSLKGAAKPPGYYTDWYTLAQDFVEEYFPPSRTFRLKDGMTYTPKEEEAHCLSVETVEWTSVNSVTNVSSSVSPKTVVTGVEQVIKKKVTAEKPMKKEEVKAPPSKSSPNKDSGEPRKKNPKKAKMVWMPVAQPSSSEPIAPPIPIKLPAQKPVKKEKPRASPKEAPKITDPGEMKQETKEKMKPTILIPSTVILTKDDPSRELFGPFKIAGHLPDGRTKLIHANGKIFTLTGGTPKLYFMNFDASVREILSWDVS
ncbi:hypothetical protein LINPERHAP1_LOCUS40943 [Linum perenne]